MRQVPPGWCTVMAVRRMNASSAGSSSTPCPRQLVEHEITQRRLTHQVARDAHRIAHLLPVFLAGQEVLVDARRGQRIRARHRDAAPAARMQQDGAHGEAVLERLPPGRARPGRERRRRQQELQVGRVHALGLHEAHHPARHVAGETFAAQVGAHHRAADAVQPQLAHEGGRAPPRRHDDRDVVLQIGAHAGTVQPHRQAGLFQHSRRPNARMHQDGWRVDRAGGGMTSRRARAVCCRPPRR